MMGKIHQKASNLSLKKFLGKSLQNKITKVVHGKKLPLKQTLLKKSFISKSCKAELKVKKRAHILDIKIF